MSGRATPAQVAAFVTALRIKGETVAEITGLARTMRLYARRVPVDGLTVDTCGTGGDAAGTFNISTVAAFVAAGAGLRVAKHGNRAMTSQCGSADVLEALGVRIDLGPEEVGRCIEEAGIGFMFAPVFHPAMKHAAVPRREIGIRTVFNILGPLTNPAGATAQLIGVADVSFAPVLAGVLQRLGCQHGLVVHGGGGLDELSTLGPSTIWDVTPEAVYSYSITPEELGLARAGPGDIRGGTAAENATFVREVLEGAPGPRRDVVLLNAAAAIVAGGLVDGLADGLRVAAESIDSGRAGQRLERLVEVSQSVG